MIPALRVRQADAATTELLQQSGYPPLLARLFAARGIRSAAELQQQLSALLPPEQLTGAATAAQILADAIAGQKKLLIIADYDADGATSCALGMKALQQMGARVDYLVPNRFTDGYGLTPSIVTSAQQLGADVLITVDNGIASIDGVAAAHQAGMQVVVTDHHLPGEELPQADAIVNPNQPGCTFPSKAMAGVGVIFYVMLALRAELRQRGAFQTGPEPNIASLLDLVALGTIADVARLDSHNRLLVAQGVARIRAGRASPGVNALLQVAGRNPARVSATDLGFAVGPRLNAAGRLDDMRLGIACLLADNAAAALPLAQELDRLNRERQDIESDMQASALARLEQFEPGRNYTLVLHEPDWHLGVIGILASRLKDKYHRPVITFALSDNGELKGSGRSISSLHLRDALDLVAKRHPGMIVRFGGHAAAAGLTLADGQLPAFAAAFESVVRELLQESDLQQIVEVDGELTAEEQSLNIAEQLEQEVWGQGFPPPLFYGEFDIAQQRIVGEKHLKLVLQPRRGNSRRSIDAMLFRQAELLDSPIKAVYRLTVNEYNGDRKAQLILQQVEPA